MVLATHKKGIETIKFNNTLLFFTLFYSVEILALRNTLFK